MRFLVKNNAFLASAYGIYLSKIRSLLTKMKRPLEPGY